MVAVVVAICVVIPASVVLTPTRASAAEAPRPNEERDGWSIPTPAAVALQLRLRGTADRVAIRAVGLAVAVARRRVEAPRARALVVDGLGWRKERGDRAEVRLDIALRAVRKGASPTLEVQLGAIGGVEVEVWAGRRLLARARFEDARKVEVALDPAALDALPAVPKRRFEPRALAFYYAWYGRPDGPTGRWRHWDPRVRGHASTDTPTLGYYDSADAAVIAQHAAWIKAAGLDGIVISWWSDDEPGDALLQRWLDAAQRSGFVLSVYLEDTRSVADLRRAVARLRTRFGAHPAWMRQDGLPVVFTYGRVEERVKAAGIAEALGDLGVYVCAMGLDADLLDHVDALHAYYHARHYERYVGGIDILARAAVLRDRPVVATVMPGYDDRVIRRPGFYSPRGDGARWRHDWAVARAADWVLVTSFNEWHEGSEIEPSVQYGDVWLQATADAIARWKAAR